MGAILYVILVVTALSYWDLAMKIRMVFSIRAARRFMDHRSAHISRILFRMAQMYAGLTVKVDASLDAVLPDACMIIANHQSLADIPFLIQMFPTRRVRFVAKRILGRYFPTVSTLLRYQRHALVSRSGDFSLTYRALRRLSVASRRGVTPAVFPEGTRSKNGAVAPFHEGAARILLQMHSLPVVTVAIDGGFAFSRLRTVLFRMRGAVYRGKITSVRPAPRDKAEIVSLLTECRAEIIRQLEIWRRESRPRKSRLSPAVSDGNRLRSKKKDGRPFGRRRP